MIRHYEPGDLDAVMEVFRRSVHGLANRDYASDQLVAWAPETMNRLAWGQRLSDGAAFVCERGQRIAGFTRIEASGYLDLLYVLPECSRQGVATALFRAARAWALDKGIRHLRTDASTTARPFFERVGFRIVERQVVERRGVSLTNWRMEAMVAGEPPHRPDPLASLG